MGQGRGIARIKDEREGMKNQSLAGSDAFPFEADWTPKSEAYRQVVGDGGLGTPFGYSTVISIYDFDKYYYRKH